MEKLIVFNGVRILLTTGSSRSEVQNWWEDADVVISVYPGQPPRILKEPHAVG